MNDEKQIYTRVATGSHSYVSNQSEINLVELWISVRPYKKQFSLVFVSIFLALLALAYTTYEQTYSLVTTMQIGTIEKDDAVLPIESPDTFLSKINNSIIPGYTHEWSRKNNHMGELLTTVTNPNNTNIILLSNKVTKDSADTISDFQKELAEAIKSDHKSIANVLRLSIQSELTLARLELNKLKNPVYLDYNVKTIEARLAEEETKLKKLEDERYFGVEKAEFQNKILMAKHEGERLKDSEQLILKQIDKLGQNKKILFENITETKTQLEEIIKDKKNAESTVTASSAMVHLLIDNEVQKNQNRLFSLEERYHVELENKKAGLLEKIDAIQRQKIEAQKQIDLLEEKYNGMLTNNQLMREQIRRTIEMIKLELQQTKLTQEDLIARQEEKVHEIEIRNENFSETRIVSAAIPSLKSSGLSYFQLTVISSVIAALVGFVVVLFSMFLKKVKERDENLNFNVA